MEIHKERFESWVESLPDDRVFDFMDNSECVVCRFIKETSRSPHVTASGESCSIWGGGGNYLQPAMRIELPEWLVQILILGRMANRQSDIDTAPIIGADLKRFTRQLLNTPTEEPVESLPHIAPITTKLAGTENLGEKGMRKE